MAHDGRLLALARERLDEIRAENQAEHARRQALIYSSIPEIQSIDRKMRSQMTELVRLTVSRAPDLEDRIAHMRDANLDMQMRKAELLNSHGYPIDYLDDIYSCRECKDTGSCGGQICRCLEKLYNAELTKALGSLLKTGDESFENFDLSLYSDKPLPGSDTVPRDSMTMVYDVCRKYAEVFPDVQTNLLLNGPPGLGKTYLSACIAKVVAGSGCSVCYESAASALDFFERQKFSRDPAEAEKAAVHVRRMLSCDLMILDDLGTEMITGISTSALYTLINSRLTSGKRMIISTNLNLTEISQKYTPQIYSRIAGEFLSLPFAGRDIRLMKKGG